MLGSPIWFVFLTNECFLLTEMSRENVAFIRIDININIHSDSATGNCSWVNDELAVNSAIKVL